MLTYKYRLYTSEPVKKRRRGKMYVKHDAFLDSRIDIAAEIWNHCIALHRRYYKLYGKHLSANRLKVHITKLKKLEKYQHWNDLGSQAIQDVVERIDKSYKAFFAHLREHRSGRKSPPRFQKRVNTRRSRLNNPAIVFMTGITSPLWDETISTWLTVLFAGL